MRIRIDPTPDLRDMLYAALAFFAVAVALRPTLTRAAETRPDDRGPWKVVSASWIGGDFEDDIVAAGIAADGSILPGSTMHCIAVRGDTVVVAGSAVRENKASPTGGAETTYPVPSLNPLQPAFGGGQRDGYFVVLRRS